MSEHISGVSGLRSDVRIYVQSILTYTQSIHLYREFARASKMMQSDAEESDANSGDFCPVMD